MKKKNESQSSNHLWWADIVGYEGLYQVSIDGEVKSLKWGKERTLKPARNGRGYLYVDLCKDGQTKKHFVHRLVAQAWLPNTENLPCVNHKDENPSNNNVENLEWCSVSYNNNYNDGQKRRGEKRSKPVIALDPKTGMVAAEFRSIREAGRNGYNQTAIYACCHGKLKAHKGLVWLYKGTSDEEIDRRIAKCMSHRWTNDPKPVVALDKQGRVVCAFPSTQEAQRHGFHSGNISLCCRGILKTHRKLVWLYKEDFLKRVC